MILSLSYFDTRTGTERGTGKLCVADDTPLLITQSIVQRWQHARKLPGLVPGHKHFTVLVEHPTEGKIIAP